MEDRIHRAVYVPPADAPAEPTDENLFLEIDRKVWEDGVLVDRTTRFPLIGHINPVTLMRHVGKTNLTGLWRTLEKSMAPETIDDFEQWADDVGMRDLRELIYYIDQMVEAQVARPTGGQPPSPDGLPPTSTGSTGSGDSAPVTSPPEGSPV